MQRRRGPRTADKAYSSKANRDYLAKRGIKAAIPVKEDQATGRRRRGSSGGRPPNFDKQRYRDRNTVERTVNKLRGCRATATRYEKRNYMYLGTIAVTSIWIWLRNPATPPFPNTLYIRWSAVSVPPRQVRRLRSLGRMESCQRVRRRGTRPSCVSGRSVWSPRSGLITSRTGPR